jgi:hypothetical protein
MTVKIVGNGFVDAVPMIPVDSSGNYAQITLVSGTAVTSVNGAIGDVVLPIVENTATLPDITIQADGIASIVGVSGVALSGPAGLSATFGGDVVIANAGAISTTSAGVDINAGSIFAHSGPSSLAMSGNTYGLTNLAGDIVITADNIVLSGTNKMTSSVVTNMLVDTGGNINASPGNSNLAIINTNLGGDMTITTPTNGGSINLQAGTGAPSIFTLNADTGCTWYNNGLGNPTIDIGVAGFQRVLIATSGISIGASNCPVLPTSSGNIALGSTAKPWSDVIGGRLVLSSPDGSWWTLTVSNSGTLAVTAL